LAIEIPYYSDIDQFLAPTGVDARTEDPFFFCLRLREHEGGIIYKPPFKRGFYFAGLLSAAQRSNIFYDDTKANDLTSLIVFQSPGLVYSSHCLEAL
jgi:AraC family transcriptional activator of pobA